jgi:hypothetical protein
MTNRVELSIAERFPFANGHEFGSAGEHERLIRRAHFAVDPTASAQHGVTDIDKAPCDSDGLVCFTADFSILKPADPNRGNRRIFLNYGNRGNKRMLQFFDDAQASNGVAIPREPNSLPLMDFGTDTERGLLQEPPRIVSGKSYPVLVPAVDADGNETAGVRAPMVAAPLGTYTGWNLRSRGFGHGAMHEFSGSYVQFPESPEEQHMTGDPRRSVLDRYRDAAAYVAAITAAARRLVEEGFMLEEDVERAATAAANWGRPRHDIRLT